jgi:hypothetical protein
VFLNLNISNIFGCRAVSLFDIRKKTKINNSKYFGNKQIENNILFNQNNRPTDSNLNSEFFTDNNSTLIDGILNDDIIINRRNISINRINYIKNSDPSDGVTSDSDNNIYINTDIDIEEYIDTDEIDFDKFSDTEINANSDSDLKSDIFNIIDNKYFADNEKIRTIF